MTPSVIIIPVLNNPAWSRRTIADALAQTGVDPLHVLVIDQDSDQATQEALAAAVAETPGLLLWRHAPTLPSLAATWNAALDFAWGLGARDALVLNNDIEIPPEYYHALRARSDAEGLLFLSGIGVRPEQYRAVTPDEHGPVQLHPDFSAFLIQRPCHQAFPFDEHFVPAYCEDCDIHRRLLLADHGRAVGKINLPFLHHASGTLKSAGPKNEALARAIHEGSRTHYRRKWGGDVNQETAVSPNGQSMPFPVTNDVLRALAEQGVSIPGWLYEEGIRDALRSEDRDV